MSNQKITELKSLTSETIADGDLFTVVDVSSNASPTGESKNISTINLVKRVVNSSIDQINAIMEDTAKLNHSHSIDDIINLRLTLNGFISSSQIGEIDGVAPLGSNGKINQIYLPDTLSGSDFVRTIFGRSGNVTASAADYASYYILSSQIGSANGVAGLNAISKINVSNIPTATPNGIASLDSSGKVPLSQLPDLTTGSFPVTSFNGRTGAITPSTADYATFYVSKSGGTLTGALNVPITPTQPSHSVSKQYVDNSQTGFLLKSGGTMTGDLNVLVTPTQPSHSVSKQYVDNLTSILNVGIKKFSEDVTGGRQTYDAFAYIDKEDNARVIGDNFSSRFGALPANAPSVTLNLPNFEKADKLYVNKFNVFIISQDGNVYSSGRNTYGECGIVGIYNNELYVPTLLSTLPSGDITKVVFSSGIDVRSFMFLSNDGKLYSCGYNANGQLGKGDTNPTNVGGPTLTLGPGNGFGNPTLGVSDAICIGSDGIETYASILSDGTVWTVGYGGKYQMGNGSGSVDTNTLWSQVIITDGSPLTNVVELKACGNGGYTTLFAKTSDNKLYAWGYNGNGQIADGTLIDKDRATLVDTDIVDFWCYGSGGSVFVKRSDGFIYACGYNAYGQLGVGNTTDQTSWANCSELNSYNVEQIHSGNHSYGPSTTWARVSVSGSTQLLVTGHNNQYQHGLGDVIQRTTFTYVPFSSKADVQDIDSEYFTNIGGYTVISTVDGNIYHTGQNRYGWGGYTTDSRNFFSRVTSAVVG